MDDKPTKKRTRWLRFTIRDLLWLALLAAVLVSWGLDHHRLSQRLAERNSLETFNFWMGLNR